MRSARPAHAARDVMLAIDISGSMDERDFVTQAGEKVRRLDGAGPLLRAKGLRSLAHALRARRAAYGASERYAFRDLLRTLRDGDPNTLDRALHAWLARLPQAPSLPDFSRAAGEEIFAEVLAINRASYGNDLPARAPDRAALANNLQQARSRYLSAQAMGAEQPLPPLNPSRAAHG